MRLSLNSADQTIVLPTATCDGRPHASRDLLATMSISETFVSRQGEGRLTGVDSFFIRTSGCNLRCWFCDTPYASWNPSGTQRSIESLLTEAAEAGVRHVVLTGGEPLIMKGIDTLARELMRTGMHLTIETAGTVDAGAPCDLLSLSPKLSASTPSAAEHAQWAARHQARRLPIETMRTLINRAVQTQIKFVVDCDGEFDEIDQVVGQLDVMPEKVWIMPQGTTAEQIRDKEPWLRPWAERQGYRYCDRMQIHWYGNRRGS